MTNEAAERLRLGQQVAIRSHLPKDIASQADAIEADVSNEAAERLRRLGYLEHTYSPEDGEPLAPLLDKALAAERRATVERIRHRLLAGDGGGLAVSFVRAILDEEAAR